MNYIFPGMLIFAAATLVWIVAMLIRDETQLIEEDDEQ